MNANGRVGTGFSPYKKRADTETAFTTEGHTCPPVGGGEATENYGERQSDGNGHDDAERNQNNFSQANGWLGGC